MGCSESGGGRGVLTPETNVFPVSEGARSRQSTSAAWPWKLCNSCPLSTSHNAHVPSPLDVRIFNTSRKWEGRTTSALKFSKSLYRLTLSYKWIVFAVWKIMWPGYQTSNAWLLWIINNVRKLLSQEYGRQWFLINNEREAGMNTKTALVCRKTVIKIVGKNTQLPSLLTFYSFCFVNLWMLFVYAGYSHLHIRVGEATGGQVVCVHGHWLLLGSQVLILVQRQRIHWAFVVQAPVTENNPSLPKKKTEKQTDVTPHWDCHD